MVDRIRRKFLLHAACKLNVFYLPHDYIPIQRPFSLENLSDRQHSANIFFPSNLLSSKINSSKSLSCILFNVSCHRARLSVPFHIPFSSSNYYLNSPIICPMHIVNTNPLFYLQNLSLVSIKHFIIFIFISKEFVVPYCKIKKKIKIK